MDSERKKKFSDNDSQDEDEKWHITIRRSSRSTSDTSYSLSTEEERKKTPENLSDDDSQDEDDKLRITIKRSSHCTSNNSYSPSTEEERKKTPENLSENDSQDEDEKLRITIKRSSHSTADTYYSPSTEEKQKKTPENSRSVPIGSLFRKKRGSVEDFDVSDVTEELLVFKTPTLKSGRSEGVGQLKSRETGRGSKDQEARRRSRDRDRKSKDREPKARDQEKKSRFREGRSRDREPRAVRSLSPRSNGSIKRITPNGCQIDKQLNEVNLTIMPNIDFCGDDADSKLKRGVHYFKFLCHSFTEQIKQSGRLIKNISVYTNIISQLVDVIDELYGALASFYENNWIGFQEFMTSMEYQTTLWKNYEKDLLNLKPFIREYEKPLYDGEALLRKHYEMEKEGIENKDLDLAFCGEIEAILASRVTFMSTGLAGFVKAFQRFVQESEIVQTKTIYLLEVLLATDSRILLEGRQDLGYKNARNLMTTTVCGDNDDADCKLKRGVSYLKFLSRSFTEQIKQSDRLIKNLSVYINTITQLVAASNRLYGAVVSFYEDNWNGFREFRMSLEHQTTLWQNYEVDLLNLLPIIQQYVRPFYECNILLDKHNKLEQKGTEDKGLDQAICREIEAILASRLTFISSDLVRFVKAFQKFVLESKILQTKTVYLLEVLPATNPPIPLGRREKMYVRYQRARKKSPHEEATYELLRKSNSKEQESSSY